MTSRLKDRRDPPVPGDSLAANDTTPGGTAPQSVPRAELAPPPLASNAAGHLYRVLMAGDDMAETLRGEGLAFAAIDEWQAAVRDLGDTEGSPVIVAVLPPRTSAADVEVALRAVEQAIHELSQPEPLASRKAPE